MKYNSSSNSSTSGFSYIETIVSITIISLLLIVIYSSYYTITRVLIKSRKQNSFNFERIQFDENLRNTINSVELPAWTKNYEYKYSEDSILLTWINGKQDDYVFSVPKGFKVQKISPLFYNSGNIAGLEVSYEYKQIKYECSSLFASIPYGEKRL